MFPEFYELNLILTSYTSLKMSQTELLSAHHGLQRLCCAMPPIETIAPSDLTGDLFQAKTYLVTICEKFLEKSLQRFGSDNNDRRARHVKMMDLAFSFRTCQRNLSAPGACTAPQNQFCMTTNFF